MTAANSVDSGWLKGINALISCYKTLLKAITMGICEPDAPQLDQPKKQ